MTDIFFDEASFSSALLDTVGALIVVIDDKGQILSFNRTCEQLTGYTQAEILGSLGRSIFITKRKSRGKTGHRAINDRWAAH